MTAQVVPEDDSPVSRADRALFVVEKAFALVSGLAILTVMIISVANILGRKLFNLPVPGFVDWMEQLVPVIAFVGIAYCQRLGGHIRMDLVIGQFRGRVLYALEWIGTLFILLLALVLIWGSWRHFVRSFDFDAPLWSRDSTIDLSLPIWPIKLVVPVMLTLLVARLVLQLWAYTRAFLKDSPVAAGVPRVESAAEQAEREAETVSGADDDTTESAR